MIKYSTNGAFCHFITTRLIYLGITVFIIFIWGVISPDNGHKEAIAIRRIFSLVDMITKTQFSNCPNVFKIGLFR